MSNGDGETTKLLAMRMSRELGLGGDICSGLVWQQRIETGH